MVSSDSALVARFQKKRQNSKNFGGGTAINGVMDTIWGRKFFEVGGHWPLWRG